MKLHRFVLLAALSSSPAFSQAPAHLSYYAPDNAAIVGNNNTNWDSSIRIAPNAHSFWVGGAHRMWIRDNGNIGIGVSNPSARLEIADAGNGSFRLGIGNNASNAHAQIRHSLHAVAYDQNTQAAVGAVSWNHYNDGNSPTFSGVFLTHGGTGMSGTQYGVQTANSGQVIIQNCDNAVIATNGMTPIHISPFSQVAATFTPNGNVGIGTTNPSHKLQVQKTSNAPALMIGGEFVGSPRIQTYSLNADANAWMGLGTDMGGGPYEHSVYFPTAGPGKLTIGDYNGVTYNTRMTVNAAGNVGIGTTNPTHKLAVNGTIKAKEVIVETGWSDYVFADDYRLAPLSEVEAHIKTNKHLPGIPSATHVAENGVSLGEVQSALLAKVEELTLHLIAQEKNFAAQQQQLTAQQRTLQTLQRENTALQTRLRQLETR